MAAQFLEASVVSESNVEGTKRGVSSQWRSGAGCRLAAVTRNSRQAHARFKRSCETGLRGGANRLRSDL